MDKCLAEKARDLDLLVSLGLEQVEPCYPLPVATYMEYNTCDKSACGEGPRSIVTSALYPSRSSTESKCSFGRLRGELGQFRAHICRA